MLRRPARDIPSCSSSVIDSTLFKADGSITTWGNQSHIDVVPPTDSGYTKIFSSQHWSDYPNFMGLKADGSLTHWGHATYATDLGQTTTPGLIVAPPTDTGYTQILSHWNGVAAMKEDGSISVWGRMDNFDLPENNQFVAFANPLVNDYLTPNQAPTGVSLTGTTASLAENADTSAATTVATIVITDDGEGTNTITLSGTDANDFEVVGDALQLVAGTALDFETKTSYAVTVNVRGQQCRR